MFLSPLSLRSNHVAIKCLASVNNHHGFSKNFVVESEKLPVAKKIYNNPAIVRHSASFYTETPQKIASQCIRLYSTKTTSKTDVFGELENSDKPKMENDPSIIDFSVPNFNTPIARHSASFNPENLQRFASQSIRFYSTEVPSKADIFGELGNRHFEKSEMDEDEKAEEKFVENEARVPRRYRLTPGGYANLIKKHIQNRDLKAALQVLDDVKQNRDKPTAYMYNLLLRAFAVAGDLKKSRSLYATMKKLELPCNAATYTSILNACANYHHSPTALNYLADLRNEFMEKNIVLNETHYHAMIKAYGKHNEILEAFKLADEMRDKRLPTNEVTFNSLLIGAISDQQAGLRHALAVWHLMKLHKIKPTITTYNLMLRAIRDTKFGDLKVFDSILSLSGNYQIVMNEGVRPDLLDSPPSISSLAVKKIADKSEEIGEEQSAEQSENLPAIIDCNSDVKTLTIEQKRLIKFPLANIHRKNRLILFGGVTGILERMEKDNVLPDTKTITILMELVPNSAAAEKSVIKTARSKGVALDIDFYNMLMKKRSLRKDYAGAKEILDDIQRAGLCPDIITWGILSMGCETSEDARTLIEGMELTGHRLNPVIATTIISTACRKIRFGFILEMMETMARKNVKAPWELYTVLDNFQTEMEQMIKSKKFSRTVNHPAFKAGFSKFNLRYSTWKEEMNEKRQKKHKKT